MLEIVNSLIHQRVEDCRRGENPKVIARVAEAALHAHIFPRYSSEQESLRKVPVWAYDWVDATIFDPQRDCDLMEQIRGEIVGAGIGA